MIASFPSRMFVHSSCTLLACGNLPLIPTIAIGSCALRTAPPAANRALPVFLRKGRLNAVLTIGATGAAAIAGADAACSW
ncbi:hypothetical protein D3C84_1210330 [compost metagenome]